MTRVLLALLILSTPSDQRGRFERFCSRLDRSTRGFECNSFAFFEAFPASGSGTSGPCSTTAPTGARGEVLTFARASNGTCTKTATGGLATTGIANGDLVVLSSNQARVEYDANGTLELLVESAGTSSGLRSEELENVAWTSTATVTANAATPPNTTNQTSNAEQLSDVSGAAFQGSCQTVVTASATQHSFYVYLQAGTIAKATVTMTGTGSATGDCTANTTALSGTSWSILGCSSAAAYAGTLTAVTFCVNVGTVVGDTGTIMAWGADYKVAAPYRTSYIPTVAATVTRAAESMAATLSTAVGPSGCIAASATWPSTGVGGVNIASLGTAG